MIQPGVWDAPATVHEYHTGWARLHTMSVVCAEIQIAAEPNRVWQLLCDPDRLGDWVTIHRGLRQVSDRPLKQGSTLEQALILRGAPFHVKWTVTELSKPHRLAWEGRGPARSKAVTSYELRARDGGTHFSYRNEFKVPLGPVGAAASRALVGGVSQREADKSLKRLKGLLEPR